MGGVSKRELGPASCEIGRKLQQGLRDSISERMLAEAQLGIDDDGERSFESRWDEFVVATETWASGVFARQIHMSSCTKCKAAPPK
jgi:hypothetical protein